MEENYSLSDHPEWIPTQEQLDAGITETDLMREFPPEEEYGPDEYWPRDEFGDKIPIREWTTDDFGNFPDEMRDWLIETIRKEYGEETAGIRLLKEMEPSEIRDYPRIAYEVMRKIVREMGITPVVKYE